MRADHRGKDRKRGDGGFAPDELDYYERRKAQAALPFSERYPIAFRGIMGFAFLALFGAAVALIGAVITMIYR